MSPMSLVTLPVSELSEDARLRHCASTCGERSERRLALWASTTVLALAALVVWIL